MEYKFDIVKDGPGIWYVIHSNAYNARNKNDIFCFKKFIKDLADNFRCE